MKDSQQNLWWVVGCFVALMMIGWVSVAGLLTGFFISNPADNQQTISTGEQTSEVADTDNSVIITTTVTITPLPAPVLLEGVPSSQTTTPSPAPVVVPTVTETPTSTPSPTATPTETPSPTLSPTPTTTPSPSTSPTLETAVTVTNTPTSELTGEITQTPSPTGTPTGTATPTPTSTSTSSATPTHTATREGDNTPQPTDTPTQTPAVTSTPGKITGRILFDDIPAGSDVVLRLEKQDYSLVTQATTTANGFYTFSDLTPDNDGYVIAFSQEDNTDYSIDEVVSWAWLGNIPVQDNDDIQLPDFDIAPLGFELLQPNPNESFSIDNISADEPIVFSWSAYPNATSYWIDLTKGDNQTIVWQSSEIQTTSVSFSGRLDDSSTIQPGEYWWGVGAVRAMGNYDLTIYGYLQVFTVEQPN